jgi:hypothetical protein
MSARQVGILTVGLLMLGALVPPAMAAPSEATRVWRAQLEVRVCDVEHAGTDDSVRVELNADNKTYLDYPRDDFKRADVFTYDLNLEEVGQLSDITGLLIEKTGSDGLCLQSLALLLNGRAIFSRGWGASGFWLDNATIDTRTYLVPGPVLRFHPLWATYVSPLPSPVIPRAELESRIAALVGTEIHGNPLYWGKLNGRGVEVSRRDATAVHVDLDLAYKCVNDWGDGGCADPGVDVDFDIRFTCAGGELTLTGENIDVDLEFGWYLQWLGDMIELFVLDDLPMHFATSVGVPFCPAISVNADGDVVFSLPPPPPPPALPAPRTR